MAGRIICVGVFGVIAFQSLWGVGMCLSLLPVAGLTLPIFSVRRNVGGIDMGRQRAGAERAQHSYQGLFDER
jgi:rod shape determining protein RodA